MGGSAEVPEDWSRAPESTATGQPSDHAQASLDDQLLTAAIAQRYYFENLTRIEIAKEFGLSRFKVGRLLESAVSNGLVRIEIVLPD